MKLTARLMEILQALYWNVGSDPEQGVTIDWDGLRDQGHLQCAREENGRKITIGVAPQDLRDLVRSNLIRLEHKNVPLTPGVINPRSPAVVYLLPEALNLLSEVPNQKTAIQTDGRLAMITLDTSELTRMLQSLFSVDEHKEICLEIGLDYESVVPANVVKTESARAIVNYTRRHSQLTDLLGVMVRQRPHHDWTQLLQG